MKGNLFSVKHDSAPTAPWLAPILVLVAFLNALCFPLINFGLAYAPHLSFAALRAFVAGFSLAMVAIALRRPLPRDFRDWITLGAIGLGATTLGYLGMFHAAEFVSPGLATMIANSQPLIAAILALAFLSERMRIIQYVGLGVGFLGIVVTSLPQFSSGGQTGFSIGLAYIVLSTSGVAFSNVLMKALGTRVDPLLAMAAQLLLGAIPLAVMALLVDQPSQIQWSSPVFMLALLGLALPGTAIAYGLWFWILGRVPLGRANAFTFLTPSIALAFGIVFFDESIGTMMIAGLVLATFGVVLVERGAATSPLHEVRGRSDGG
jgi:drug/metabolite transporter (DMT)-like permease